MSEREPAARFGGASVLTIAGAMTFACAVLRLAFAESAHGLAVTLFAATAGTAGYFGLAFRRCRAAERLEGPSAAQVPLSRTQASRPARSMSPHQGR